MNAYYAFNCIYMYIKDFNKNESMYAYIFILLLLMNLYINTSA